MATTTKTLTPTNQTVTLPDMTERPNASVLVDGIGKEADAINALSEQIQVTDVPITMNPNITWGANTLVVAKKCGNMVIVSGVINISSNLYAPIATVPSEYKPSQKVWFPISGTSGDRGAMKTDGVIETEVSIPAGFHAFNFIYPL